MKEEIFPVTDEFDNVIGSATRKDCHGNPGLIHRTAHVLVFNSKGELLLQKRSARKDIQPGKWDTSVGGHLKVDEDYETAAYRELAEELGIEGIKLKFLYKYPYRDCVESENVATYICVYDGTIKFDEYEITQVREWTLSDIKKNLGQGTFTPHFEEEFKNYLTRENPPIPSPPRGEG